MLDIVSERAFGILGIIGIVLSLYVEYGKIKKMSVDSEQAAKKLISESASAITESALSLVTPLMERNKHLEDRVHSLEERVHSLEAELKKCIGELK